MKPKKKAAKKHSPTPVVDRRYQQALGLFEKAVKALGRKDFDRARGLLDDLLDGHPEQRDLLERARTYRALCERSKRPGRPKTFEELVNFAIVQHNRGDFAQAIKLLTQALEIHPRNESALYCLAAAHARAGDPAAAIKSLRSAISANPASRAQARKDADFEPLRGAVDFEALVAPTLS